MSDVEQYEVTLETASLRAEAGELRAELRARGALRADPTPAARIAELERSLAGAQAERDAALRDVDRVAGAAAVAVREEQIAAEYRARVRELEQLVSVLSVVLGETRADIERAAASRAWRYGHKLMRAIARLAFRPDKTEGALARALARLDRVAAATRALPPGPETSTAGIAASAPLALPPPPPATVDDDRRLADLIRDRIGSCPARDSWPPVSIVVLNRGGREHLERLTAGLERNTDYGDLQLVVVDNGSADGSADYLEALSARFPIEVLRNAGNVPFSEANEQGAARATNDLLLFLNNDIEPFERGWLKELVAALEQDGVAAVGARLLHHSADGAPPKSQHHAIAFGRTADGVRPYNLGDGADPFGPGFGLEQPVAAVTAACMLIRRADFEAVGGFTSGYRYGTEDVDLGLKLTTSGRRVLASGRAVLFHNESASQRAEAREVIRANRTSNRRIFLERWGAEVRRAYRVGRLDGDPFWTDGRGPHIAITVTSTDAAAGWGDWYTAHELGDDLEGRDWRVTYIERRGGHWYELPDDLDYVLTLMDPFDARHVPADVVTIAWIRNWTDRWLEQPWFERLDLLLASSEGSARRITEVTGRPSIHFPLATNPARFATAAPLKGLSEPVVFTGNRWGEAREIEQALLSLPAGQLAVYGGGWQKLRGAKRFSRGPIPYSELPAIYTGAEVVLDDSQAPCLRYGSLNARVFDALAAGTPVLTNCVAGVRELFDADFPVWTDPGDLAPAIDALLSDDQLRERLASRYQREVLTKHTYAHRAGQLIAELRGLEQHRSYCIKIGAPGWEEAERWGDLPFARALGRELKRLGHRYRIEVLPEWDSLEGLAYDVVLHLKGLRRYTPKPGQFNVLWCISHPDELSAEECDGYDLVCVASSSFAEELSRRTATKVCVLEQATDPRIFYPDPAPEFAHELVYVANSRNILRPIVRDLLPTDHDLAIYGGGWDGLIDPALVRGAFVANDELRKVYSSARIVLADHWDDMRRHGFISNRIYDAVACGAFVISDDVPGLSERFGDRVATYRSRDELRDLIEARLSLPPAAHAPADPPPSFADRVETLLATVDGSASWSGLRLGSGRAG